MKTIAKAALGALALASLGAVASAPAEAATSFGFSIGPGPYFGGYYGGYYGDYYPDPCLRAYPYRPGFCYGPAPVYGYTYDRPYYYGPRGYVRFSDRR